MAKARYLRKPDSSKNPVQFAWYEWPLNALGRYVSLFMANAIFDNDTNRAAKLTATLPGDAQTAVEIVEGNLQQITDQGNKTSDWLDTGGYAMKAAPARQPGEAYRLAGWVKRALPYYNQGPMDMDLAVSLTLGELIADLAIPPPPVQGAAPTWNALNLPSFTAGGAYRVVIPASAVTVATGVTLASIAQIGNSWLQVQPEQGTGNYVLFGSAPQGITQQPVTLRATDSAGKTADVSKTIIKDSRVLYAAFQYVPDGGNQIIFRIGENFGTDYPTVRLFGGPSGWPTATKTAAKGEATILNKPYFYTSLLSPLGAGTGNVAITQGGVTFYGTITLVAGQYQEREIILSLTPPTNQANYSIPGSTNNYEGSSHEYSLVKNNAVVPGAVFRATGMRAGTTLTDKTVAVQINSATGDGYSFTLEASEDGTTYVASVIINVLDATVATQVDSIQTIRRKFVPDTQTEYYLIRMTQWQQNDAMKPVFRNKNSTEGSWRSAFGELFSSAGQFADFNEGYHYFAFSNLSIEGVNPTVSVWQFKRSLDAPDSTIIELSYQYGSQADLGTTVHPAQSDPNDPSNYAIVGTYNY